MCALSWHAVVNEWVALDSSVPVAFQDSPTLVCKIFSCLICAIYHGTVPEFIMQLHKKKCMLGGFGRNWASYWARIGDKTFPDGTTDELNETHRLDSIHPRSTVPCSNPGFAEISTEDEKRNKL